MRTYLNLAVILVLGLGLGLGACQKQVETPKPPTATAGLPPLPAGATATAPAASAPPAASGVQMTGTVIERIDAPPYSYLHLSLAGGGEDWAAVNQTQVKAGDKVTVTNVSRMDGFESKTLKRTFEKLVFGNLVGEGAAAPAPAPAAAAAPAPAAGVGSGHTTVAAAPDVHVERATGPGAASIAEVYANKAALKDKEVAFRGKVVKYNSGIMGKNWLHVQDGSGTESKGDHDIAVTTSDEAKVGDIVTVRGPVHLDRDLGAGYAYAVIVEDAKLQR